MKIKAKTHKKSLVIIRIIITCFLIILFNTPVFSQVLQRDSTSTLQYLIKKGNESHDIVVMLHGYGSNEKDLFSLSNHFPQTTFITIRAPQKMGPDSFSWFDISFQNGIKGTDSSQANISANLLSLFLAQIKKTNKQKIIIGGFSQGAIMSLKIGIEKPNLVQGLMCFSGTTLGKNLRINHKWDPYYKKTQAFYAHGTLDQIIPIAQAKWCKKALQDAGIQSTYKEYMMAHEIKPEVIQDAIKWYLTYFR